MGTLLSSLGGTNWGCVDEEGNKLDDTTQLERLIARQGHDVQTNSRSS